MDNRMVEIAYQYARYCWERDYGCAQERISHRAFPVGGGTEQISPHVMHLADIVNVHIENADQSRHYDDYRIAELAALNAQAEIKRMRKEGEAAANAAKDATVGTLKEKCAAISWAWVPYHEKIAQLERDIVNLQATANKEYDAWRGL